MPMCSKGEHGIVISIAAEVPVTVGMLLTLGARGGGARQRKIDRQQHQCAEPHQSPEYVAARLLLQIPPALFRNPQIL